MLVIVTVARPEALPLPLNQAVVLAAGLVDLTQPRGRSG
jgi:hypothetical protein